METKGKRASLLDQLPDGIDEEIEFGEHGNPELRTANTLEAISLKETGGNNNELGTTGD